MEEVKEVISRISQTKKKERDFMKKEDLRKFDFAIRQEDDIEWHIVINTKERWLERLVVDYYTEKESKTINQLAEKFNLSKVSWSTFEYNGNLTFKELKAELIKEGLDYNLELEAFLDLRKKK